MLALSKVEKGHNSSLLVLGRVAFEDLVDDFFVLRAELERDGWVVVGLVAVLDNNPNTCQLTNLKICLN